MNIFQEMKNQTPTSVFESYIAMNESASELNENTHETDVDFYGGDYDHEYEDAKQSIHALAKKHGVKVHKFIKNGPAGGNPNAVLRGHPNKLLALHKEFHRGGGFTKGELSGFIHKIAK